MVFQANDLGPERPKSVIRQDGLLRSLDVDLDEVRGGERREDVHHRNRLAAGADSRFEKVPVLEENGSVGGSGARFHDGPHVTVVAGRCRAQDLGILRIRLVGEDVGIGAFGQQSHPEQADIGPEIDGRQGRRHVVQNRRDTCGKVVVAAHEDLRKPGQILCSVAQVNRLAGRSQPIGAQRPPAANQLTPEVAKPRVDAARDSEVVTEVADVHVGNDAGAAG